MTNAIRTGTTYKTALAVATLIALAGCASPSFDKAGATLDACCLNPTPADAMTQKFLTSKVRMQMVTFCTTR